MELNLHEICEKFGMESNGFALFHNENFKNNHDLPCYVSENADTIDEVLSRNDIKREVVEWLGKEETKEYLLESYDGIMPIIDEAFIEGWVVSVYENIEWTGVSTYLNDYLM